ncbi:MAG: S41 family peptidase [Sphingobacterium sp.]
MNKYFSFLCGLFSFVGLLLTSNTYAQQETLLLRNPSVSADHIAFVYAGDIWIADKDGQHPRRLTANPGVEQNPMFSPDGKQIAFTGNYDGNTDVYIVPIYGGSPVRVTYHPASDILRGWLNNAEVYFTTTREFTYSLGSRLYKSAINAKQSTPLMMPEATQGSPSGDGRYWAYIKNTDPTERDRVAFKRYRGGGMPSIWIFDTDTKEVQAVPGENSNDVKPVWLGDKVYFLSDREKTVNIYSYDVRSKALEKLTDYNDFDVRTLNGNGQELCFEYKGKLHLLNTETKKVNTLSITVHNDALYKRPHYIEMGKDINAFAISPTGQRALFENRGEIFTVPKEKGDARNISLSPGSHERYPQWSPDGKWISYISDKNGTYQLVLRDQFAKKDPVYISLGKTAFYNSPTWSPDSKKLVYNDVHLNLYYVDIQSQKVTLVDDDKLSTTTGRTSNHFSPSWSFDSNWIAYIKSGNNGVRTLFMYDLSSGNKTQITDGMSTVSGTSFSKDNKYLFFNASTNQGLTNSGLHMTAYEKNVNYNVYAFILSSESPSLLKSESDEEKLDEKNDKEEKNTDKKDKAKKTKENEKTEKGDKKDKKEPTKVDFKNIANRILALPLRPGYYTLEGSVKGKLIFKRGREIGVYDLEKLEEKTLVDNASGFALSADGKKMIYGTGKDYFIVDAGQKPAPGAGKVEIKNVKQLVDPQAEWTQVFNEVWNMQREFFYVENMHGVDWPAMKAKYSKFLPYVGHRSDLGYLLNEMMGEMVVGHNYIYPGDEPSTPSVNTGVLGADLQAVANGYKIDKIYTRLDWNPSFKAPLAEPGMKVTAGDYIVAVNGISLDEGVNIYALLENTVDKQVVLSVNDTPTLKGARELLVRPISFGDEISIRKMDWVECNRKKVDALSDGQIAYVYMPNTGREGYTYFNRYYFSQMDKKALLLDERNNGGGSVADYVIDLLSRELIAGWKIRDGKSFTTPGNGIYGPKAMIINENAGSGGDMMPYMFRFKGLGKLIGRTTMGILVGISGYPPLLDGGRVTSPNFGVFDLKGNYIIENQGVAPDIFVEQMPKDLLEGRDPQLERTVEHLLQEIKTYPHLNLVDPQDPIRVR